MTVTIYYKNGLLNLPEEIFRMIFTYLDDKTLFYILRLVCHQLKTLVENYVELGKLYPIK